MSTVPQYEYALNKSGFLRRHAGDFVVETSPMDEYGVYHKEYICSDGAIWYERMSPEWVSETVEIKHATVKVEVKMFRTEFWSTDNAESKYYYEQF